MGHSSSLRCSSRGMRGGASTKPLSELSSSFSLAAAVSAFFFFFAVLAAARSAWTRSVSASIAARIAASVSA